MAGIKETKEGLEFVILLSNAIGRVMEDNKADISEILSELVLLIPKLPEAVLGAQEIPVELSDLDSSEVKELEQFFLDRFDIPQDGIEEIVEDHLVLMVALYELVDKHYTSTEVAK